MWQVAQAAHTCCRRGVLHRNIKLENLLINKDTLEVKLIDFGCGDLLKTSAYETFWGTEVYCPPEFEKSGKYHGKPATVWSLGVLLFELVCGDPPESKDLDIIEAGIWSKPGLSKGELAFTTAKNSVLPAMTVLAPKVPVMAVPEVTVKHVPATSEPELVPKASAPVLHINAILN
ncbi:serine/threonine-protein kinase pim-1-like [Sinocyclocheilus rhinocerous]|uniref:serine/threonine-protein kinase pim-1-like n=1 Tax=Sinocyclocheilus rhinocerous TaxID=307959 RepID=UPI0007B8F809|nr:PREDICTED: serine/threonine-protein kinase pim-1-like [Sinocyclocheilus rhinocerous]